MTRRKAKTDAVTPELRLAILDRDKGCVVAQLAQAGHVERTGACRSFGELRGVGQWTYVDPGSRERLLTIAHVRDRFGGRMGRRPPSDRRHLAAVCWGHHLADPVIDRKDVRRAAQEYLRRQEGEDDPPSWSRASVDSAASDHREES